ncbi:hypothetical protein ACFOHK_01045 [Falsigemmobacter intermedius]|uniref:Uncharacterized protein n=1 Tax=Falsigemmobacter intermedius TaxID=1553448 RepID=A0A451GH35_9RHOB|nr:hypothetical protein [Falsigemmobacter intermedius]RWY37359.1 hypothetical protein EP867_17390 [Falsigemmobacter intermedius]
MEEEKLDIKIKKLLGNGLESLNRQILDAYKAMRDVENELETLAKCRVVAASKDGQELPSEAFTRSARGFLVRRRLYIFQSEIPSDDLISLLSDREKTAKNFLDLLAQKHVEEAIEQKKPELLDLKTGFRTAAPIDLLTPNGIVEASYENLANVIGDMNKKPANRITYRADSAWRGSSITEEELAKLVRAMLDREKQSLKRAESNYDHPRAEGHRDLIAKIEQNWAKFESFRPLLGEFSARVQSGVAHTWRCYFGPENYRFRLPNIGIIRGKRGLEVSAASTRDRPAARPHLGTLEFGRLRIGLFVDSDSYARLKPIFDEVFGIPVNLSWEGARRNERENLTYRGWGEREKSKYFQ